MGHIWIKGKKKFGSLLHAVWMWPYLLCHQYDVGKKDLFCRSEKPIKSLARHYLILKNYTKKKQTAELVED